MIQTGSDEMDAETAAIADDVTEFVQRATAGRDRADVKAAIDAAIVALHRYRRETVAAADGPWKANPPWKTAL